MVSLIHFTYELCVSKDILYWFLCICIMFCMRYVMKWKVTDPAEMCKKEHLRRWSMGRRSIQVCRCGCKWQDKHLKRLGNSLLGVELQRWLTNCRLIYGPYRCSIEWFRELVLVHNFGDSKCEYTRGSKDNKLVYRPYYWCIICIIDVGFLMIVNFPKSQVMEETYGPYERVVE